MQFPLNGTLTRKKRRRRQPCEKNGPWKTNRPPSAEATRRVRAPPARLRAGGGGETPRSRPRPWQPPPLPPPPGAPLQQRPERGSLRSRAWLSRAPYASFRLPAATYTAAAPSAPRVYEAAGSEAVGRGGAALPPRGPREALGGDQAAAARPGPSSPLLLTTARPPRPGFPPPPGPGLTRILRLISVPISMAPRRAAGSALRGASLGRCAEPAPRPQLCRHCRYTHRRFWLRALRDPPPLPRRAGASRAERACACACASAHLGPRSLRSGALCWRQGAQRRACGLRFSLLWAPA